MDVFWAPDSLPPPPKRRRRTKVDVSCLSDSSDDAPALTGMPAEPSLHTAAASAAVDVMVALDTCGEFRLPAEPSEHVLSPMCLSVLRAKLQGGVYTRRAAFEWDAAAVYRSVLLRLPHSTDTALRAAHQLSVLPAILNATEVGHSGWLLAACGYEPGKPQHAQTRMCRVAEKAADEALRILGPENYCPPHGSQTDSRHPAFRASVVEMRDKAARHLLSRSSDVEYELRLVSDALILGASDASKPSVVERAVELDKQLPKIVRKAGFVQPVSESLKHRKRVLQMLTDLKKEPCARDFVHPVECEQEYRTALRPMDVLTVEMKLDAGLYSSVAAVIEDLSLIPANCVAWFGDDRSADAVLFSRALDRLTAKHRL